MKEEEQNTSGRSLARIREAIMIKMGIDNTKLKILIERFIAKTKTKDSLDKKHHHKTNAVRTFTSDKLTFYKLVEFWRILEIVKVEIRFKIHTKNKKVFEVEEIIDFRDEKRMKELNEKSSYHNTDSDEED